MVCLTQPWSAFIHSGEAWRLTRSWAIFVSTSCITVLEYHSIMYVLVYYCAIVVVLVHRGIHLKNNVIFGRRSLVNI